MSTITWEKCWLIPRRDNHVDPTAGLGAAVIAEARWGDFAKAKLHFDAVKFIIDKAAGPYAVQAMPLIKVSSCWWYILPSWRSGHPSFRATWCLQT